MEASELADINRGGRHLAAVDLRYVARASLLPELSRQTYDALWKAIREAVLNSVDASAQKIEIDFSQVRADGVLSIVDDGQGMSMTEFCERFMSLGGSVRYGNDEQFGRIGIGSLALLQYGAKAVIESKKAGADSYMRAEVGHSWDLSADERRAKLGEVPAGIAKELQHDGPASQSFTRVVIEGVSSEVQSAVRDPSSFYALCDRLRRVLPLPLGSSALLADLEARSPGVVADIRGHVAKWCAPVLVHSPWERDIELTRRVFGDEPTGRESWVGPPAALCRSVRVRDGGQRRRVVVLGYLLTQERARPDWAGITARVQNVAVEEQTFFDVTADPGFRKYVTGEVWILGDVCRERLINIDRASFNRESFDYRAIQRVLAEEIVDFKTRRVQHVQRARTRIRRRLEEHRQMIDKVGGVLESARGVGLAKSEPSRTLRAGRGVLARDLAALGAVVTTVKAGDAADYSLGVSDDGTQVCVRLGPASTVPEVHVGGADYRIRLCRAGSDRPAMSLGKEEVVINLDHPIYGDGNLAARVEICLALELSYLTGRDDGAEGMYEQMMSLMSSGR